MKLKITIIVSFLFLGFYGFCQEKKNPIIFLEVLSGYSNGSSKGFTGGGSLNYQYGKNLFTVRNFELSTLRKEGSFVGIPFYVTTENIREYAFLYGRRIIKNNESLSYSAGISYLDRQLLVGYLDDGQRNYTTTKALGFPFELNIKWFNSKKERYRIYEIIKVGKPTAFANSIGFKIYGDISKSTFVGIGVTVGLGWHKIYEPLE